MTIQVTSLQYPDFNQYPLAKANVNVRGAQFYFGDINSRPMMLLHHLISQGILNVLEEDFINFRDTILDYDSSEDKKAKIALFHKFLSNIQVNTNDATVHFIGVLLKNDNMNLNNYVILKILEKLDNAGQQINILFNYESYLILSAHEEVILKQTKKPYHYDEAAGCSSSLHFSSLFQKGILPLSEFKKLIEHHYLPHVNLINYTTDPKQNKNMTVMSYGVINLWVINQLAKKLGVPFNYQTLPLLKTTIGRINVIFKHFLKQHNLKAIITNNPMKEHFDGTFFTSAEYPIEYILCNYTPPQESLPVQDAEPYQLTWLHGAPSNVAPDPSMDSQGIQTICIYTKPGFANMDSLCHIGYSADESWSLMLDDIFDPKHIPKQLHDNYLAKMHGRFLEVSLFNGHRDLHLFDFAKMIQALATAYSSKGQKDLEIALNEYFENNLLKSKGTYMDLRQWLANQVTLVMPEIELVFEFEVYKQWIDLLPYAYLQTNQKHTHGEVLAWVEDPKLSDKHIITRFYHR